jgi:serine/threonine-protein kinase
MPETSQIVGNYELLGLVDKPKAGVTYKVRNRKTGEFEALRTLPGASYSDGESVERFLREIRIHTRMSHPNLVEFHDVAEVDGHLVMTSEFVEGPSLAELCARGPLAVAEAVRVTCGVLAGLEEAHALGIVHRGITAEHVTVTREGAVKLGGFGLAKPAADVDLTRAGAVVGDARYMSPEQVLGTEALDTRADLYSVGVLLFYGLTGRLPFTGANEFDVMVAQVKAEAPKPGISAELDGIVLRALAKKPEERFAGAAEFRAALEGVKLDAAGPKGR